MTARRGDAAAPRWPTLRRLGRSARRAAAVAVAVPALLALSPAAGGEQSMDRSADGSTVTLVQGGSIRLTLPLNAGTGYEWRLLRRPPAVVAVAGEAALIATAERPGGPVAQAFDITGVAPGSADLSFGLVRPWEQDTAPAERFSVTIDVTRP